MNKLRSLVLPRNSETFINTSTLSGAVDIVVTQFPDGSRKFSRFNVRFGRILLHNPEVKTVVIFINGEDTCLTMCLDRFGDAYFNDDKHKHVLSTLNLNFGPNNVEFNSFDSKNLPVRLTCTLFFYDATKTSLVVSDIDGTITKSDAIGMLMPNMFKNSYSRDGVCELYNNIQENGYKLLYLSSRAIGQSESTKKYLFEKLNLPRAPVILSNLGVIKALKREVYDKTTFQFKTETLTRIQELFGRKDVFVAGFGNNTSDCLAYKSVNVAKVFVFLSKDTPVPESCTALNSYTEVDASVAFPNIYYSKM